ncbi:MAG TPA: hypothetical protein VH114_13050, partial [Candidatus Acidoferrum sp.]|nr:hypothetical protein [Candidatus Acidoferrum sp.]
PNFDDSTVCIGDFWAASEGLDDLIIRIGRMIAYQEYNTKSPLNGLAAKWAEQHAQLFPVDARDIAPPLEKAKPHGEESPAPVAPMEEIVGDSNEVTPSASAAGSADPADRPNRRADQHADQQLDQRAERVSIE